MKFNKIGTSHKNYLNQFKDNLSSYTNFSVEKIDGNRYLIRHNDEKVMAFNSRSTFMQFLNTLEAFGMIEKTTRGYNVIKNKFEWEYALEYLFKKSDDKTVQSIRESRIISSLAVLNLLSNDLIKKLNISKKRGIFKVEDALIEASVFEDEMINDTKKVNHFIERFNNEYTI